MQKLLLKILKGILYFFGVIFILSNIGLFLEGDNIIFGLLSIIISFLILPISYSKIKEFIFNKKNQISNTKFILYYVIIVFLGYIISFGVLTNDIANKQSKEREKIEAVTKLDVEYSINDNYTTKEELEIQLSYNNIENLKINDKEVGIKDNSLNYKLPLELGENNIDIVGTNNIIERKFNKKITRITLEEEQEMIEKEREKIALEEKQKELDRIEQEKLIEKQKKEEIDKVIDEIKVSILLLEGQKNKVNDYTTIENIKSSIYLFGDYASIVNKYKNHTNNEVIKLLLDLEDKASALQSREFPKMRKAYVKIVDTNMWEYNIDVYSKGTYNGTIEFVGGYFASNKNKLDTYSTLKDMLVLLRFDRANFKWYEYDDEYTYWNIESLMDNKVAIVK